MARQTINSNSHRVTLEGAANNEIFITGLKDDKIVVKLTVVSGSIKFSTIGSAALSNLTFIAEESTILTIFTGQTINAIGSNGNQFDIAI